MEPRHEEAPDLTSVMEARDSISAAVARGLLEGEGIPVMVQSFQIPWYNGIMTAAAGAWGRVLVPTHLADAARQVLAAYFEENPEAAPALTDPDATDAGR